MIVSASSDQTFFTCRHKRHEVSSEMNYPPRKDLGGYQGITKGHLVVAGLCCHGSTQPLENLIRSNPHEAYTTYLRKDCTQGCPYSAVPFRLHDPSIPIT